MKPCFQRHFSNISCIFNLSKHVPIEKKWQKQRERVLTNCNHAKSDGNVVSTKAYASSHKKQFLGQFQIFLILVGLLRMLTHGTRQLHLLFKRSKGKHICNLRRERVLTNFNPSKSNGNVFLRWEHVL